MNPSNETRGYGPKPNRNPKNQPGKGDGTRASNAATNTDRAYSDHYPDAPSTNSTDRIRPEPAGQELRGYVHPGAAPETTRPVGVPIERTTPGASADTLKES